MLINLLLGMAPSDAALPAPVAPRELSDEAFSDIIQNVTKSPQVIDNESNSIDLFELEESISRYGVVENSDLTDATSVAPKEVADESARARRPTETVATTDLPAAAVADPESGGQRGWVASTAESDRLEGNTLPHSGPLLETSKASKPHETDHRPDTPVTSKLQQRSEHLPNPVAARNSDRVPSTDNPSPPSVVGTETRATGQNRVPAAAANAATAAIPLSSEPAQPTGRADAASSGAPSEVSRSQTLQPIDQRQPSPGDSSEKQAAPGVERDVRIGTHASNVTTTRLAAMPSASERTALNNNQGDVTSAATPNPTPLVAPHQSGENRLPSSLAARLAQLSTVSARVADSGSAATATVVSSTVTPDTSGSGLPASTVMNTAMVLRSEAASISDRPPLRDRSARTDSRVGEASAGAVGAGGSIDILRAEGGILRTDSSPALSALPAQLARQVMHSHAQNISELRLQLKPEELGSIDLKLRVDGDRVHVAMVTGQSGVRELLEAQLPQLRQMLEQGGLQLGDVDVSQKDANSPGNQFAQSPAAREEQPGQQGIDVGQEASGQAKPADGLIDAFV